MIYTYYYNDMVYEQASVCARRERVIFFSHDNTKNIVWRQVDVNGTYTHTHDKSVLL